MISHSLTIGEIIDKLKTQIFDFENPTDIQNDYLERENGIKRTIDRCMMQMKEFAITPGLDKLTKRQELKTEKCIENLSRYVKQLMEELDEDKIKIYCDNLKSEKEKSFNISLNRPFEPDLTFMLSNSFHIAIRTEILWSRRVTVLQAIQISKGELDLDDLGKHLPDLLEKIKTKIIPNLKHQEFYLSFADSINEAIKCYDKKLFRGCNLILMTTIEGMVRQLANFLSIPHELGENFSEDKYMSLNRLLRDVTWKKDITIDETRLSLMLGKDKTLKEYRSEFGIDRENVLIDLDTRLDFLKGRFKDDRDLILHGSYQEYNKKWNLYLNFSAFEETYEVCEYYLKKYSS
ncbi:hypothetical protein [Mangrovimonas futianensis]|uniref:hypothetical protein n=1 Tax=Mangrovimonas futianensis TaxID=2895523 RepID=UPI001E5C5A20|nr:hypothetical protein [Mangrovimonas futianensis]MCF1422312.1 hypothetical protein [Mangrovimonas futianensis]